MSLATKIAAGLCICPVVAAPPAMLHKPTRDKVARAAGYVPKATPAATPIAVSPQVECIDPTPSAPLVPMTQLSTPGNNLPQLPMTVPGGPTGPGVPFFPVPGTPPGTPTGPVVPPEVIPGIPEPATWTIMVVGFGLVGAALRRNSRTVSTSRREDEATEA